MAPALLISSDYDFSCIWVYWSLGHNSRQKMHSPYVLLR